MVNPDDDKFGAARDVEPPLASVILGLEEIKMGDVIDVRPDRFLREMREYGNVDTACSRSGMARAELEDLCRVNPKFDFSQIECYLEFMEEAMMAETRKRLGAIRMSAINAWKSRHSVTPEEQHGGR